MYNNLLIDMDKYRFLLQEIINSFSELMGPELTIKRARQSGMELEDDGTLIRYNGEGEESTINFLNEFKALSGNMSIDYLLKHLGFVFDDYPELKTFLIEQKTG